MGRVVGVKCVKTGSMGQKPPNCEGGSGYNAERGKKMRKVVSGLYNLARLMNDFSAILSGKPGRIARRGINKKIGRLTGSRLFIKGRRGKR